MNRFSAFRVTAALLTLLVGINSASAIDEVVRKSEETAAKGNISEVTKTQVVLERQVGDDITVPANDIVSIRWDDEPLKLNLARNDEKGGRLEKALAAYQEALGEVSGNENIQASIEYLIARTTAKMALNDATKRDEAVQKIQEFQQSYPDHYRYYESLDYLGQVHLAAENYTDAQSAFDQLAQAPWSDYQMAAKIANAKVLLNQGDVDGALQAFNAVASQDASGPAEVNRKQEAMLGKATCQIRSQQYEQAIQTLDQVAANASGDATGILAQAFVRKGDCLQSLGRSKEAVLAYLHVPVLFPQETTWHAEALYHLSRLWGSVNQPERGAAAREELLSTYPNSEWARKLTGS